MPPVAQDAPKYVLKKDWNKWTFGWWELPFSQLHSPLDPFGRRVVYSNLFFMVRDLAITISIYIYIYVLCHTIYIQLNIDIYIYQNTTWHMNVNTFISKCNSGKGWTAECHHSKCRQTCSVIDPSYLLPLHIGIFHSKKNDNSTTSPYCFSWKHVIFTSTQLNSQKLYIKPLNKNSNQQIRHFHHQSLTFSISPFNSSNSPASAWTSNGSNSMGAKIEAKSRVFREFSKGFFRFGSRTMYTDFGGKKKGRHYVPCWMLNI